MKFFWVVFVAFAAILGGPVAAWADTCATGIPALPSGGAIPSMPPGGGMLTLPGGSGTCASALSIAFTDSASSVPGTSTVTYNNLSIGAPNATRFVVVAVTARNSVATSSVKIGATNATQVVADGSNGTYFNSIWYAPVPSGTNANIQLTSSGSFATLGIAVYAVTGSSGLAVDAYQGLSGPCCFPYLSTTFDIHAGGVAVWAGMDGQLDASTVAYSSATKTLSVVLAGARTHSSAYLSTATDLLGHTENMTWSGDGSRAMVGASFKP